MTIIKSLLIVLVVAVLLFAVLVIGIKIGFQDGKIQGYLNVGARLFENFNISVDRICEIVYEDISTGEWVGDDFMCSVEARP